MTGSRPIPNDVDVVIEVPRGSFVKRSRDGAIEFISPLPCPFNYGAVPTLTGGDQDHLDALVLGPRLAVGTLVTARVQAVILFVDGGRRDDKLICAARPLGVGERIGITVFFCCFALGKWVLNHWRGQLGRTAYRGWGDAAAVLAAAERG